MTLGRTQFPRQSFVRLVIGAAVIASLCGAGLAAGRGLPSGGPVDLVVRAEVLSKFLEACDGSDAIKAELLQSCHRYLASMEALDLTAQERLLDAGGRELRAMRTQAASSADPEAAMVRLNAGLLDDPAYHETISRLQVLRVEIEKEVDAEFERFIELVRNKAGLEHEQMRNLESAALADCLLARSPSERVASDVFLWDLDLCAVVEEASKPEGVLARAAAAVGEDGVPRLHVILDRYRSARDEALRAEWRERRANVGRYPGIIVRSDDDPRYQEIRRTHADRVRRFWRPMSEANDAISIILRDLGAQEQLEAWTLQWCRTVAPFISKKRAVDDMFDHLLANRHDILDEPRLQLIREMARNFNTARVEAEKAAVDACAGVRMDAMPRPPVPTTPPRMKTFLRRCASIYQLSTTTADALMAAVPEERACLERLAYLSRSRDRWGPDLSSQSLDLAESREPFDLPLSRADVYADTHPRTGDQDECRRADYATPKP